ncbi:hypothetical protein COV20_01685 [Candidatus Woesearchaeota archaeon CG10_big_fil_rev_8_21_14_0_10_45_16]|nr:MAG: hypothetical protein COV20_01685 [Candidatus Woesearchaeota archaeon CG10_big_fil_rev_8_21_14_0_10_45_16]
MKKEIVVIGDVEIGGGTLTDDFISDKALSAFIGTLTRKKTPVDFILNGDSFDFMKCPYIVKGKNTYPRHITEKISLAKLKLMEEAHAPVFEALRRFVSHKKNRLFFTIGNHDHDLFYEGVQERIKELLKSKENVFFRLQYHFHGVYAEHGQQYDFLNKINPKRAFITYRGEKILNIPWLAFGLISRFMTIKEEHPFMERIKPYPTMFSHHKAVLQKINRRSIEYVLKSIIYYPLRYFYDPTYTIPREIFRELYRRLKNRHWDIDNIVPVFKRRQRWRANLRNKIHVLGHVHEHYLEQKGGWIIIHPDTWRDEYTFDETNGKLYHKPKKYVHILVEDDDSLQWEVKDYPIKRSVLRFDDVLKDEVGWVKKAAAEEGYPIEKFLARDPS